MLGEETLDAVILQTAVPRLFIAPSTLDLLGVELEIHRIRIAPTGSRRRSSGWVRPS